MRLAEPRDIEESVKKGRMFAEEAYPDVPYCEDSARETMMTMIERGTLVIAEHHGQIIGGIGGFVCPRATNREWRTLIESFWWLSPEHRGRTTGIRLLMAFEQRARDLDCNDIYMMAMEHINVESVEAMYLRLGYSPKERGYHKRF